MSEPVALALDAPLLSRADLATWARVEIEPDDAWAKTCVRVASALVREAAHQPGWTLDTAPAMARIVAAQVALRGYLNPPEGETSSGIGPINSRVLDAVAEGFYLSDGERERLAGYAPSEVAERGSRFWVVSMAATSPAPRRPRYRLPADAGPTTPVEVEWLAEP